MENKKFMGVCYGISEKFEFDVTFVRIAFIIIFLAGPITTLVLYFLLSFVFPEGEDREFIL